MSGRTATALVDAYEGVMAGGLDVRIVGTRYDVVMQREDHLDRPMSGERRVDIDDTEAARPFEASLQAENLETRAGATPDPSDPLGPLQSLVDEAERAAKKTAASVAEFCSTEAAFDSVPLCPWNDLAGGAVTNDTRSICVAIYALAEQVREVRKAIVAARGAGS